MDGRVTETGGTVWGSAADKKGQIELTGAEQKLTLCDDYITHMVWHHANSRTAFHSLDLVSQRNRWLDNSGQSAAVSRRHGRHC